MSRPSESGSMMSSRIRSGRVCRQSSSAPLPVCSPVSEKPSFSRLYFRRANRSESSSMRRIFFIGPVPTLQSPIVTNRLQRREFGIKARGLFQRQREKERRPLIDPALHPNRRRSATRPGASRSTARGPCRPSRASAPCPRGRNARTAAAGPRTEFRFRCPYEQLHNSSRVDAPTTIRPPACVYLMALSSRLLRICETASLSHQAERPPARARAPAGYRSSPAIGRIRSMASASSIFTGWLSNSNLCRFCSTRDSVSRSSVIRASRSALCRIIRETACCGPGRGSRRPAASPCTPGSMPVGSAARATR